MPTVLRFANVRIAIYPNDHPPAHVHVIAPDWEIVVNVDDMSLRETFGCAEHEAQRILRLLSPHRDALLEAWRKYHA